MSNLIPISQSVYKAEVTRINKEIDLFMQMYDAFLSDKCNSNHTNLKDTGKVINILKNELAQIHQRARSQGLTFLPDEYKLKRVKRYEKYLSQICENDGSLPEVLNSFGVIKQLPMDDLYTTYKDHRRLTVFAQKGLKCAHLGCDRIGSRLILTLDLSRGIHADIYTHGFDLMTVDHIYPKSLGGGEEIENKQPMCQYHNTKKSNKVVQC